MKDGIRRDTNEPIEAEVRPESWTLSSGGVLLLVLLVALLALLLASALSGLSPTHLLGLGGLVLGIVLWTRIYRNAREPVSTEAWFDEGQLVVRDPNPWWKRLTDPFFGWKLRLVVQAIEWKGNTPIITGYVAQGVSWGRKFRIRLKPNEEQADALTTQLAEVANR